MNEKDTKLTKEELEEDRFVEWLMEAADYVQQKWQVFAGGLVVLVLVIYGINYSQQSAANNRVEAMGVWGDILIAEGTGQTAEGVRLAESLVGAYAGTPAAGQGMIYLANRYFQQERYSEAQALYQRYLDEYGDDPALRYGAWSGLAVCLDAQGQHREAAEKYRAFAAQNPGAPQTPLALGEAARCFGLAGDGQAQREVLEELVRDFADSPVAARARQELDML